MLIAIAPWAFSPRTLFRGADRGPPLIRHEPSENSGNGFTSFSLAQRVLSPFSLLFQEINSARGPVRRRNPGAQGLSGRNNSGYVSLFLAVSWPNNSGRPTTKNPLALPMPGKFLAYAVSARRRAHIERFQSKLSLRIVPSSAGQPLSYHRGRLYAVLVPAACRQLVIKPAAISSIARRRVGEARRNPPLLSPMRRAASALRLLEPRQRPDRALQRKDLVDACVV
jgi:hypothetical protein